VQTARVLIGALLLSLYYVGHANAIKVDLLDVSDEIVNRLVPAVGTDANEDFTEMSYYLKLDQKNPILSNKELTYIEPVITRAAWSYALYTGDYKVSLRDIIDAGFFPYDIFPNSSDYEACITNSSPETTITYIHLIDIGTEQWIVRQRQSILWAFYTYYYFPSSYRGIDTEYPILEPDNLKAYHQFWINPYTNQPADYGKVQGGLRKVHLGIFSDPTSPYADDRSRLAMEAPMFCCSTCKR
jgi:hypothetical protein